MNTEKLNAIIDEIRKEQQISPFFEDATLANYVNEGIYNINGIVGEEIDYEEDKEARNLLKTYVMYANHKRLAEFEELYRGKYARLHIKYNQDTDIS